MATDFTKRPSPQPPLANHRIKSILERFQRTADRSLNGPYDRDGTPAPGLDLEASHLGTRPVSSRGDDHGSAGGKTRNRGPSKRPGPALQPPERSGRAPGKCEVLETTLEGQRIACFEVGGEQRLCMPQILSTILRDFDPRQVFQVCEELHIFFSRCDPVQLGSLIRAKILPQSVATCGLITYTNAERMCSTLLRNQSAYKYRLPVAIEGLKVYHECFGGCRGVFMPEAFESPSARCIQCGECGELFAPSQFVSHSHSELENGTIHWGFNPVNWKSYLMLSLEQTGYPRVQELLDTLKTKFEDGSDGGLDKIMIKQEVDEGMPLKRIRCASGSPMPTEGAPPKWEPADVGGAWKFCIGLCKQLDNIQLRSRARLPPFLQTDVPFLADSDRIVPYPESQRGDRNFAPNVTLDPAPYKNLHDMYDDDEGEDCDEKESVMADEGATTRQSHRWLSALTSPGNSAVHLASKPGTVSDDESDDSESVLSDKLPAITEDDDDDDQACDRIPNVCNARIGLLIRALEGEIHRSANDDPLQDFIKLQGQHSDIVSSLADKARALFQRRLYLLTLMEDKLRVMDEARKNQDEELACLRQDSTMRMQDAAIERFRLMEQIKRLSSGSGELNLAAQVTQYKEESEILRKQLQSAQDMNANLRREVAELHRAIEALTQSKRELYAPPLVVQPEVAATTSGPRSRPRHRPMSCTSSSVCSQGV